MVLKNKTLYRFEGFEMDPVNRVFASAGKPIFLHSRTFDLLSYMVRNGGRLLTKDELMNAIWGDAAVEEANLTQGVFLLRKALGANRPDGAKLIVTVPGRGYKFLPEVEEVFGVLGTDCDEITTETPEATPPQKEFPGRRWILYGVAGSFALLLLAAAGWLWQTRAVPGDHHEVVLADFENVTGDPGFDKALNIALSIDLKQSPFLLIAPDAKARKTLELMKRSPKEKLTTSLAREVCQRIGAQAVLSGMIARFGKQYLVTLAAYDCVGGQELVQTKAVAASGDNVLQAIDSVAAQMRGRLGEPLKSLRRFDKPLLPKATGSLDALRAYSAAHELGMQGKFQESVPLFQRAIELDPKFAIAYSDLGTVYNNLGEPNLSAAASRKAYELRDLADERERMYITAAYHSHTLGDLHATVRDHETWIEMYPRDPAPLTNLSDLRTQIGQPELAIDPAKRSLALDPKSAVAYVVLARAQLYAGRVEDSIATCRQAIAQNLDGAELHGILIQAGFAKHDRAMTEAQVAWAAGTAAEPYINVHQMLVAMAQGKPRYGIELIDRVVEGYRHRGMQERADRMLGGLPRLEAELGMIEAARKLIDEIPPVDGAVDIPVALAEVGEDAKAEIILREEMKKHPEDTLWQYWKGPQVAAAIALSRNKPLEAIEALRRSIAYDLRDSEVPAMRGRAFLAAKQYDLAEGEFRKIVDHPTAGVVSANVALAHLGLARARAFEGNVAGSRAEYDTFFALWKDAESDVPVLRQAKAEYAKLGEQSQSGRP
ncbi:MAG TPA: winged helix-turn-helix domain-containing protein [Bryobacteraceae bacterium]|jgi:DNA-binding winged helix-turn-helix (wHTH) protein/tetratricopeptide (TPR) repeat protein|nr:winged helix-turn-helix domain-containing protein [Bryobacteraceae bacterium]